MPAMYAPAPRHVRPVCHASHILGHRSQYVDQSTLCPTGPGLCATSHRNPSGSAK